MLGKLSDLPNVCSKNGMASFVTESSEVIRSFITDFFRSQNKISTATIRAYQTVRELCKFGDYDALKKIFESSFETAINQELARISNPAARNMKKMLAADFIKIYLKFLLIGSEVFHSYTVCHLYLKTNHNFQQHCNSLLSKIIVEENEGFYAFIEGLSEVVRAAGIEKIPRVYGQARDAVNLILTCEFLDCFLDIYVGQVYNTHKFSLSLQLKSGLDSFVGKIRAVASEEKSLMTELRYEEHFIKWRLMFLSNILADMDNEIFKCLRVSLESNKKDSINTFLDLLREDSEPKYASKVLKDLVLMELKAINSPQELSALLKLTRNLFSSRYFSEEYIIEVDTIIASALDENGRMKPQDLATIICDDIDKNNTYKDLKGYWELLSIMENRDEVLNAMTQRLIDKLLSYSDLHNIFEILVNLERRFPKSKLWKIKILLCDFIKSFKLTQVVYNMDLTKKLELIPSDETKVSQSLEDGLSLTMLDIVKTLTDYIHKAKTGKSITSDFNLLIVNGILKNGEYFTDKYLNFERLLSDFSTHVNKFRSAFKKQNTINSLHFDSERSLCELSLENERGEPIMVWCNMAQAVVLNTYEILDKWNIESLATYLSISQEKLMNIVMSINQRFSLLEIKNHELVLNLTKLKTFTGIVLLVPLDKVWALRKPQMRQLEYNIDEGLLKDNNYSAVLENLKRYILRNTTSQQNLSLDSLAQVARYDLGYEVDPGSIMKIANDLVQEEIITRKIVNNNLTYIVN